MKTISGLLDYNDKAEYVINMGNDNEQNISRLLKHNWKYEIPAIYSLSVGRKIYTSEECVLQLKNVTESKDIYDYCAENLKIGEKLFNSCGKHIEFTVTTGA
jgi:hypothetical protein